MACSIRSAPPESRNFTYTTPSGGYTRWTMYQVNDLVTIAGLTTAVDVENVMYYNVPKVLVDCATVTAGNLADHAEGSVVYFDPTTNAITTVAGALAACGFVTLQPAADAVLCEIHLQGDLAI